MAPGWRLSLIPTASAYPSLLWEAYSLILPESQEKRVSRTTTPNASLYPVGSVLVWPETIHAPGHLDEKLCVATRIAYSVFRMEAWVRTLVEDRRCMDCKAEIEGLEDAMEFRGWLPHIELVGHLCEACRERREEVKRYRG